MRRWGRYHWRLGPSVPGRGTGRQAVRSTQEHTDRALNGKSPQATWEAKSVSVDWLVRHKPITLRALPSVPS